MKIIDIHGHLGNINFVPFWAADADKLAAYCRESGVSKLCLSASRSIMYDIREGNAELEEACQGKSAGIRYDWNEIFCLTKGKAYCMITVLVQLVHFIRRDVHDTFGLSGCPAHLQPDRR